MKPLYLIINKVNGYTEGSNGKKYLTLVPTDESKDTLWKISNNSDDYDKKCMKFKFNSDDDLPLKKTLDLCNIIVVRSVFHEGSFLRCIFV